jgi:hypothetical protein
VTSSPADVGFALNPDKTEVEPGAYGVALCYRSGDGATKQEPGEYGLVATRHEQKGGVFRDRRPHRRHEHPLCLFPAREIDLKSCIVLSTHRPSTQHLLILLNVTSGCSGRRITLANSRDDSNSGENIALG